MVDITGKSDIKREAVAEGFIRLRPRTIQLIRENAVEKGNVVGISKVAGIMGVKMTPQLIPLCHPIPLTKVEMEVEVMDSGLKVTAYVSAIYKTGVEMEALTGVSLALLTIWDMVKRYEKDESGQYPYTQIEYIKVISKRKGEGPAPT